MIRSSKFGELLLCPEPFPCYKILSSTDDDEEEDWSKQRQPEEEGGERCSSSNSSSNNNNNNGRGTPSSGSDVASPYATPPWSQSASPYTKSPWSTNVDHHHHYGDDFHYNTSTPAAANSSDINIHNVDDDDCFMIMMIGSIVREEGYVYSLATCGDLLYTGSDSKNIRVWKNLREFSGFKATAGGGLVKAIAISTDNDGHTIFTGHTDCKIRIWRRAGPANNYKRLGSLPTLTDCLNKSINPNNYVHVRRNRSSLWIKHYDAVSCLSLNQELGLLYSGSWDKTVKVWDFRKRRCLESFQAHQDAVNAVLDAGFDSLLFTGSADGSLKVWRRRQGGTHFLLQVLLRQDKAITSLAVNKEAAVVYCGSSNGLVDFWEKNLSHGGVLRGHKQPVLCLVAAGTLLFTGSADRSICVWKRGEGGIHTCLTVLKAHTGPVKCLAVEQHDGDGDGGNSSWTVYSGSLDKSVKVWRVEDITNSPHFISQY